VLSKVLFFLAQHGSEEARVQIDLAKNLSRGVENTLGALKMLTEKDF